MELLDVIRKDRLEARKAKDVFRTKVLTTIVGEAETLLKNNKPYNTIDLLLKFRKGVEEILTIKYSEDAHNELCIINSYLPMELSDLEILEIIRSFPEDTPMGKIMGYLSSNYKGRFDGRKARDLILERGSV